MAMRRRAAAAAAREGRTVGTLVPQTLERPLRPGEVSLDELERAFRETAVPRCRRCADRPKADAPPRPQRERAKTEPRASSEDDNARTTQDRQPVDPRATSTRSNT